MCELLHIVGTLSCAHLKIIKGKMISDLGIKVLAPSRLTISANVVSCRLPLNRLRLTRKSLKILHMQFWTMLHSPVLQPQLKTGKVAGF